MEWSVHKKQAEEIQTHLAISHNGKYALSGEQGG